MQTSFTEKQLKDKDNQSTEKIFKLKKLRKQLLV